MNDATNDQWLTEIKDRFAADKKMIERAIGQLSDAELKQRPAPSFNSVAMMMNHIAGNLQSRWKDFLTSDGEKPDRDRESEFAEWAGTRDELMKRWETGFQFLFNSLDSLRPEDLTKTVLIRAEPHSVPKAIVRSLDHLAYHTGQILLVSRMIHCGEWQYITVAPGKSADFNRSKMGK